MVIEGLQPLKLVEEVASLYDYDLLRLATEDDRAVHSNVVLIMTCGHALSLACTLLHIQTEGKREIFLYFF